MYVLDRMAMLPHVGLMSHHIGRSFVTLPAGYRLLIQRSSLPGVGRIILSQSLSRHSADRHCFPSVSKEVTPLLPQRVPWYRTFERHKNVYYGFASRNPKPPSRFANFYYLFISLGIMSFVFTPV